MPAAPQSPPEDLLKEALPYSEKIGGLCDRLGPGKRALVYLRLSRGKHGAEYQLDAIPQDRATAEKFREIGSRDAGLATDILSALNSYDPQREIPLLVVDCRSSSAIGVAFGVCPLERRA